MFGRSVRVRPPLRRATAHLMRRTYHACMHVRCSQKIQAPSWGEYKRSTHSSGKTRNVFSYALIGLAGSVSFYGVKSTVLDFVNSMNASADVVAVSIFEVDLRNIPVGTAALLDWHGKPLFVRHRTKEEIAASLNVSFSDLKDPEPDEARCKRPEWVVLVGRCTHLGCMVINNAGDYGGWFCPCHGAHFDTRCACVLLFVLIWSLYGFFFQNQRRLMTTHNITVAALVRDLRQRTSKSRPTGL